MLQRMLLRAIHLETEDSLFLEETAIELLGRLLRAAAAEGGSRRAAASTRRSSRRELAEAARARLALRFAEREGLEELAGHLGCSAPHLCRVFRRETGRSLHAHREELRLRHALDRLDEPGLRLDALALQLGYSSHSHFSARFRRRFGVSPEHARREAGTARRHRQLAVRIAETQVLV